VDGDRPNARRALVPRAWNADNCLRGVHPTDVGAVVEALIVVDGDVSVLIGVRRSVSYGYLSAVSTEPSGAHHG